MAFADLSPAEQALLQNSDLLIRAALLSSRTALDAMNKAVLDYNAVSSTYYAQLQQTDVIPTASGLVGIVSVDVASELALIQQFSALLYQWDNSLVQQQHAQFIGAVNIDGLN